VQVNNFIKGKTTNERFGFQGSNKEPLKQRPEGVSSTVEGDFTKSEDESRVDHKKSSFIMNCKAMCCHNATDSKYNYHPVAIN